MNHSQIHIEYTIESIISAYGFSRKTFERWRDLVYSGVGDPPYSASELLIIMGKGEELASRAFGSSRHKNLRRIKKAINDLQNQARN